MTQLQYEKILKSDNNVAKSDIMTNIQQRKLDWNRRLIKLTRQEINEIVFFQKALNKIMPGSDLEKAYRGKQSSPVIKKVQ